MIPDTDPVLFPELAPFSLECIGELHCGMGCEVADHLESMEQAIAEGWAQIKYAPEESGFSNFVGYCPECAEIDRREEAEWNARKSRKRKVKP